jgi:hypothetical protein
MLPSLGLIPVGALALLFLYLDGAVLLSNSMTTRQIGWVALLSAYVGLALVIPVVILMRLKGGGVARACLVAAGVSLLISALFLPFVLASMVM